MEKAALMLVCLHSLWNMSYWTTALHHDLHHWEDIQVNSSHPGCPPKREAENNSCLRATECWNFSRYSATKWRGLISPWSRISVTHNLKPSLLPGIKPSNSQLCWINFKLLNNNWLSKEIKRHLSVFIVYLSLGEWVLGSTSVNLKWFYLLVLHLILLNDFHPVSHKCNNRLKMCVILHASSYKKTL